MSRRQGLRKRVNPIVTYTWLWPGLTRAWLGEWRGLGQSAGFALLVDGMLSATVVWDEVLSSTAAWIGWSATAVCWSIGAFAGRRRLRELAEQSGDGSPVAPAKSSNVQDLFPEALNEYLQGNWLVAEEKCRELIRRRRDDVESRLLLATLLRHDGRLDEARQALDELEKFDGAARWGMEIECERQWLEELESPPEDTDEEKTESTEGTELAEGIGSKETAEKDLPTRRAA